jgi:hypothetical protein
VSGAVGNEEGRPLVIQYWHSGAPPPPIADLLATFPRHNPGLRQLLFDEASAAAFIAERFSPRHVEAFRACAQPASQADYLRYCAGYALGGLCIDADYRCLDDLAPLFRLLSRGIVFGKRDPLPPEIASVARLPYRVGAYWHLLNGIFAFREAGDPLLELAIEVATANVEARVADGAVGVWLTTGPGVLTSIYLLERLGSADDFMRYATDTVLEPAAPLVCEVVGSRSVFGRTLAGVAMPPFEEFDPWLKHVGVPRGEEGTRHWSWPRGSIFR